MKASELKLPALVWVNPRKDSLYLLRGGCSCCMTGGHWSKDRGTFSNTSVDRDWDQWVPFDPAKDCLPEGCVLPEGFKHLAERPEPKWRAWKDRSEVPVGDVRYIRFGEDAGYWWMACGWRNDSVECHGHTYDFDHLFKRNASYSPDGVTWHRCGVQDQ